MVWLRRLCAVYVVGQQHFNVLLPLLILGGLLLCLQLHPLLLAQGFCDLHLGLLPQVLLLFDLLLIRHHLLLGFRRGKLIKFSQSIELRSIVKVYPLWPPEFLGHVRVPSLLRLQ